MNRSKKSQKKTKYQNLSLKYSIKKYKYPKIVKMVQKSENIKKFLKIHTALVMMGCPQVHLLVGFFILDNSFSFAKTLSYWLKVQRKLMKLINLLLRVHVEKTTLYHDIRNKERRIKTIFVFNISFIVKCFLSNNFTTRSGNIRTIYNSSTISFY